jgi:hypothetical protein
LRGDQGEWRLKLFTLTFFPIPQFPSPSFPPSKGEATQHFIFYKKSEIFHSSWGIEVSPLERGSRGVVFKTIYFNFFFNSALSIPLFPPSKWEATQQFIFYKKSEISPSSWSIKFPLLRGD